jgi:hypothetical protein
VASPWELVALLIAAMLTSEEAQVTVNVRIWVELSVYVPVAMNCSVPVTGILGPLGVTAIDTSVACVTVSAVEPERPSKVAVMVLEPTLELEASPEEPLALLMDALPVEESQVTEVVRF